jgi:hypothetical protein
MTTATDIANSIKAETVSGIVRFANDAACITELPMDDFAKAAVGAFGTFYIYDVDTHRSANAADYVLSLDADGVYALIAGLVAAGATTPRKVGDFIYDATH